MYEESATVCTVDGAHGVEPLAGMAFRNLPDVSSESLDFVGASPILHVRKAYFF